MESKVMQFFKELTKIPRCSGNEKKVSDYLLEFAKSRDLDVHQDKSLNIIIKKKGSGGRENEEPVILQGHMDMVCIAKEGININFEEDELPIYIDGDFIKSKGTSLGADNGIAIAMILEILDGDYSHPPIEALITTDEEVGLIGASNIDGQLLKGKTLINIDSEEEGVFLTSCAGGVRNIITIPFENRTIKKKKAYEITVSGLLGGHSGMEIDKGRASAIKLIGRVLSKLTSYRIIDIEGGTAMNAIANYAKVKIAINSFIAAEIEGLKRKFKEEFKSVDENINIEYKEIPLSEHTLSKLSTKRIVSAILALPHGVVDMDVNMPNLVETSTNLAIIKKDDFNITIEGSHRSSVESKKNMLVKTYAAVAYLVEGKSSTFGDYPGWQFEKESKIRELFIKSYESLTGKTASVSSIHAGLECGVLQKRIGKLDMISLGPDIFDAHTPKERLSISSTKRVFNLLTVVLDWI